MMQALPGRSYFPFQHLYGDVNVPEGQGRTQPYGQQSQSRGERARLVAEQEPTGNAGVNEKGNRAQDHGAGLDGRIFLAMLQDGNPDGGQRNRGRSAEQAGEAFGTKDLGDHRKQRDDCAADDEADNQLSGRRRQQSSSRDHAARLASRISRMASFAPLQPSSLYSLPSCRW